jgi:hypothetical protein
VEAVIVDESDILRRFWSSCNNLMFLWGGDICLPLQVIVGNQEDSWLVSLDLVSFWLLRIV